jgi:hypothetical protein
LAGLKIKEDNDTPTHEENLIHILCFAFIWERYSSNATISNKIPACYHSLIQEQEMIRWHQILNSLWTTEWVQQLEFITTQQGKQKAYLARNSQIVEKRCSLQHGDTHNNDIYQRTQLVPMF